MSHTPGPWIVLDDSKRAPSVRNYGGFICFTPNVTKYTDQEERYIQERQERLANARLIAAAPELLEACSQAIDCIKTGRVVTGTIHQLEQAIAKAEIQPPAGVEEG